MNLVFENLNGKTGILVVKGSDTLDTIKAKIQKIILTEADFQADGSDTDITQSCSMVKLVLPLLGMHIVINCDSTGRKIILGVEGSYTVGQVISMIERKEICLTMKDKLVLSFNGTKLMEYCTLDDYNIQNNNVLDMVFEKLVSKMQIFVMLPKKTMTLYVKKSTTVAALKNMIESKEGIPFRKQRLTYGLKILDDNRDLAYYGIEKDCTIQLVEFVGVRLVNCRMPK